MKTKVTHKRAEVLHHPCVLGVPQTRGQSQRWPTSGHKCYVTPALSGAPYRRGRKQKWPTKGRKCHVLPAFSGFPKQGDTVQGGPQLGGSATSHLRSRGSPNKGKKSTVAHKWDQKVRQPAFSGIPCTRKRKQKWPNKGHKCYITLAFSEVPKEKVEKVKGGPQVGGIATSPVHSRRSPNKETKLKVAHKLAEVLHHPCVLRGPQTRGQS